jgi:hypothetical protein
MASSDSLKGLLATDKQPKLAQLNGVVYKWFTAVYLEENPVIGRMIIEQS